MDFISNIPVIGGLIGTVVPFLILLGIVVFVHEYGHYIVGRWCGIRAETFSIGFGRELFGWTDSRGCRWRIAILPLGGFVKFAGDMDAASSTANQKALAAMSAEARRGTFPGASVERRAATVFAGPMFNFLFTILVFAAVAMTQGREANEPVIADVRADMADTLGFAPGDRVLSVDGTFIETFSDLRAALAALEDGAGQARVVRDGAELAVDIAYIWPARVDGLAPGGAAQRAGLEVGDVVIAADGAPIPGFSDFVDAVVASDGGEMALEVRRGGEVLSLSVTPEIVTVDDNGVAAQRPRIGVIGNSDGGVLPAIERTGPIAALQFGAERTWFIITTSLDYIWKIISGRADTSDLGGPIRIAEVSGQAAEQGISTFVGMIALISTSIGLINLFPIPVLDGGHLVFYAIEKLRGKPLGERWQEIGNGIGLSLVIMLMVFATYNDLARF